MKLHTYNPQCPYQVSTSYTLQFPRYSPDKIFKLKVPAARYLDNWYIRPWHKKDECHCTQVSGLRSKFGVDNKAKRRQIWTQHKYFHFWVTSTTDTQPSWYPLRTDCRKYKDWHSGEIAENTGIDPHNKMEICIECKMLDVCDWISSYNEKLVLEGDLHMRPFQWHVKEHWRFTQLLDMLLS